MTITEVIISILVALLAICGFFQAYENYMLGKEIKEQRRRIDFNEKLIDELISLKDKFIIIDSKEDKDKQ